MNKKVTIFAIVLIIVGIIGTISSSIAAIPFMTNYVNKTINDINKEIVIYEKVMNANKLNITTKDTHVEIKPSNSDKLIIKQHGNLNNSTFSVNNNENEFELKQSYKDQEFTIQGLGEFIVDNMNLTNNKIVVYVPNKVDVQVKTESGSLFISDKNILLDKVVFSTNYGNIYLSEGVKNLKNLNISSVDNINLKLSEILGIENVNISTDGSLYIDSMPDDIFIENIENYIPKNFNVVSSRYSADIHINTSIPVAQNLNIDNKSGYVSLNLPIDAYNLNFKLLTTENILIENNSQVNDQNVDGEKSSMKTFEGSFRDAKENELQYNVDVKSQTIDLRK